MKQEQLQPLNSLLNLAKRSYTAEWLKFGLIYLGLTLINLHVKLLLTPGWHDGTLDRNHSLLLNFAYVNNEQSRLLQFYIPELLSRLFGLSIPHAYIAQRWLFTFLVSTSFHLYLKKWFDDRLAFAGVLFLMAITPLTYFGQLQESAPLLFLTFLLGLWAIRDDHPLMIVIILVIGVINNETMLFLPVIYFLYNVEKVELKHLWRLSIKTISYSLPAYLIVGIIRYINRDRPHLGDLWHLSDNIIGIISHLRAFPLDYWQATYLYIFFLFGIFWILAYLDFKQKPLFIQRSLLALPLFIIPHLLIGIISEVRLMAPLSFIVIPAAFLSLFPSIKQVESNE